jgi:TRAP-type C4-dicarboxylate transport system permease small subunit
MKTSDRRRYIGLCDHWLGGLSRAMVAGAMSFLVAMAVLISLQVAMRNLFNMGLPWADELARFTGLAVVFFTVPLLQQKGKHIAVEMLNNRLRGLSKVLLRCVNEAAMLLFCILLLISFAEFFKRAAFFSTPAMGMPNWAFYSPALIGMVCCTLVTALRLVRFCAQTRTEGQEPPAKNEESQP